MSRVCTDCEEHEAEYRVKWRALVSATMDWDDLPVDFVCGDCLFELEERQWDGVNDDFELKKLGGV